MVVSNAGQLDDKHAVITHLPCQKSEASCDWRALIKPPADHLKHCTCGLYEPSKRLTWSLNRKRMK